MTPTGTTGGLVTVTAGRNGVTLTRQVFIQIIATQNGAEHERSRRGRAGPVVDVRPHLGWRRRRRRRRGARRRGHGRAHARGTRGAGEQRPGPGPRDALSLRRDRVAAGPARAAAAVDWSIGDADAIEIKLATTSGSFLWSGTFGRPAILTQTGGKYIRAPIPQDVWTMATETAGGPTPSGMTDRLMMSLVLAPGEQVRTGQSARRGRSRRVYSTASSTTTRTARSSRRTSRGAVGGNGMFGGAVLSIHVGDTAPQLVGGGERGDRPVPRVPLGRGRRVAAHRSARRRVRHELELRSLELGERRARHDPRRDVPGAVPGRDHGADRERPAAAPAGRHDADRRDRPVHVRDGSSARPRSRRTARWW